MTGSGQLPSFLGFQRQKSNEESKDSVAQLSEFSLFLDI